MKVNKKNNQYYGRYFEEAIGAIINKEEIVNNTGFNFTDEEIKELNSDALEAVKFLSAEKAEYVGRQTGNQSCDLIVDGKEYEIKYVCEGNGTYYNTSLSYFSERLGFTPFIEYTHKFICPYLEKYYGEKVYHNISPVSMEESKAFQKTSEYKELQSLDKEMRKKYVNDLYAFLKNNPDKFSLFISDMLTKNSSGKHIPNTTLVYNHSKKKVTLISSETIMSLVNTKTFKKNPLGFSFDGFNIQIGWQNGSGLNNPTIRVFIK